MANLLEYYKSERLAQILQELHRDGHIDSNDDAFNTDLLRLVVAFKGKSVRVRDIGACSHM